MLSQGRENYVFCIISTLTFQVTCRMSLVVWFIDGCALCDGEFRLSLEYENVIILCSCNMNIKNVIVSWIFRMFWSSILLYKEFLKDIPTWKWHWTYSNILEHYKYHSMNMVHWQFSLVIHVTSIYYLSDFLIWLKSLKYTGTNKFSLIIFSIIILDFRNCFVIYALNANCMNSDLNVYSEMRQPTRECSFCSCYQVYPLFANII